MYADYELSVTNATILKAIHAASAGFLQVRERGSVPNCVAQREVAHQAAVEQLVNWITAKQA